MVASTRTVAGCPLTTLRSALTARALGQRRLDGGVDDLADLGFGVVALGDGHRPPQAGRPLPCHDHLERAAGQLRLPHRPAQGVVRSRRTVDADDDFAGRLICHGRTSSVAHGCPVPGPAERCAGAYRRSAAATQVRVARFSGEMGGCGPCRWRYFCSTIMRSSARDCARCSRRVTTSPSWARRGPWPRRCRASPP